MTDFTMPIAAPKGQRLSSTLTSLLFVVLAAAPLNAHAQSDAAEQTSDLEVIRIKGQTIPQIEGSFSTSVLKAEDIQLKRVFELNELLEDIPGVAVRDFGLGGVASSTVIRGFGNGAHGGDLGIVIDGIPLNEANSHADGYADVNVIVPLEISNLVVYRGPVSALYGNFNRGGLLAIETRDGGTYAQADISLGSFDQFDAQGAFGIEVGEDQRYNAAVQYYRTDGFREQSKSDRVTAALRGTFDITDRLDASVALRGHSANSNSAAYITLDQFETDPFAVDPRTQNDGADKTFGTARIDIGYTLGAQTRLLAFGYTTQQDFTRWFSRGGATAERWRQREETYNRSVFGGGASVNGRVGVAGREVSYVVGAEVFHESTDFQFYEDLNNRERTAAPEFDRESTLTNLALYAEVDAALMEGLNLSLGVRGEQFDGDCQPLGPETGAEPCNELESVDNFAPKVGLRWRVLAPLQLRASYSEGFALAEGFAKFAEAAQELDLNVLRQIEVGALYMPVSGLELDLSLYRISSSNEVAQIAPAQFVNFGKTIRRGVEASVRWTPNEQFEMRAVYAYAESEVTENPDAALIGNSVVGVPDHTATIWADYYPIPALRLRATGRYVGAYDYNTANTLQSEDYTVFDLDAFYTLDTAVEATVFLSVDNVADNIYATTFNSIGVAPGAPRSIFAGVQLGF